MAVQSTSTNHDGCFCTVCSQVEHPDGSSTCFHCVSDIGQPHGAVESSTHTMMGASRQHARRWNSDMVEPHISTVRHGCGCRPCVRSTTAQLPCSAAERRNCVALVASEDEHQSMLYTMLLSPNFYMLYVHTLRPCVSCRTAAPCSSVAHGNLHGRFCTVCSKVAQ